MDRYILTAKKIREAKAGGKIMERLTQNQGICGMASTEFCHSQEDCYTCEYGRKCFKRLAAYEDSGLEPKEATLLSEILGQNDDIIHLRKLLRAEKEGRMVVLPHAIGGQFYDTMRICRKGTVVEEHPIKMTIDHYTMGLDGIPVAIAFSKDGFQGNYTPGKLRKLLEGAKEA